MQTANLPLLGAVEQRLVAPKTVLQLGSDEIFMAEGVPTTRMRHSFCW